MNKSQETINLIKEAQSNDIAKSFSAPGNATSGLAEYNLEPVAKLVYPVHTPIRNSIPRVKTVGGIQATWRAITSVKNATFGAGVPEGRRGQVIQNTTKEYVASFKSFGNDNFVTEEADMAAEGFADLKAIAVKTNLEALMIAEEQTDYAGNSTMALGQTPTPTLSASSTGGTFGTGTFLVTAVALTLKGYQQLAGLNNGNTGEEFIQDQAVLNSRFTVATELNHTYTVNGGVAKYSSPASIALTGATNVINAVVSPVIGAVAYAWFVGVSGQQVLHSLSTINSVVLTSPSNSTFNLTNLVNDDCSRDELVYDGLLTQILQPGSGSYVKIMPTGVAGVGSTLTSDGAGGINEIDQALYTFWTKTKLSPDFMFVSAAMLKQITSLSIKNNGAPLVRLNGELDNSKDLVVGLAVSSYMNKITGSIIKIVVHPNAIPGSIMFYSSKISYPLSGITSPIRKLVQRDYYQVEWPKTSRQYEFGVYFRGVLQNYFPPAHGIIMNINENATV